MDQLNNELYIYIVKLTQQKQNKMLLEGKNPLIVN